MFLTTTVGSLPKPDWLAEPEKLWAAWRLDAAQLQDGKQRAALEWLREQERAGIDIVGDGEQFRIHFVHGFLESLEGIDWNLKTPMGIRNNRYIAEVPTVTAPLKRRAAVHVADAAFMRTQTTRALKVTLPGPMTICDTLADAHYGRRADMALRFAEMLNEEALELEAAGADVIQFDEPAFNVFLDEVGEWGIAALERAMQGLRAEGSPVDLVTLAEELSRRGELDGVGGISYLMQLSEATPTAAYAEHYARIVAEKWTLRRLIQAAGEAMRLAYEEAGSLDEILDQAGKRILEVALAQTEVEARSMRELVHETFEHIEALFQNKGETAGVRTGFKELDQLIGTLAPGSLNIIAARPAMGKTAFALTIAQHAALKEGVGVGIYSLEMPAAQLVLRMMCSEARIDMNRVRLGQLSDRDFSRLVDVAGRLSEAPIFIDDTPDLTLMELRARARRLRSQHNVGLIIIDYLQLMSGPGGGQKGENRQQEIAAISRGLKALARELGVPVIALSQLSRAVEARPNKRPMLSDLRESGSIEQDADLVMFIYRDEYYNPHSEKAGIAEIIVGKQRNGPTGVVKLAFLKEQTRFANLAPGDYKGIVAHVPFVNVVTTMLDESIPLTTNEFDEWGNPVSGKAVYDSMLSYSPYDQVSRQAYPAMLVTTSLNDSQVMYWEPAKYVAKLRTLKTDTRPLLLKCNMGAGHGGASGRYDRLKEVSFEYAWLMTQVGITR